MTRDEARFVLAAYRPDGGDASDPALAGALHQAGLDPALGLWFERSRAFDSAVAGKLAGIAPPPGLREAIIAGGRMSRAPRPEQSRRPWPQRWVALAAAAALLFGVGLWSRARLASGPAALAEFALDDLVHGRHGGTGEATGELERRLAATAQPLPAEMAVDFARLRATGCRTLHFAGRDVLEVCFERGGGEFHLYVMPRNGERDYGSGASPVLLARAEGAAAVWSDRQFDYAVVSHDGLDAVKRLF
jgi:hypothetical protein